MKAHRLISLVFVCAASSTAWMASSEVWARSMPPAAFKLYYPTEIKSYLPHSYADHGLKDAIDKRAKQAMGFYLTPFYLKKYGVRVSDVMIKAKMNAVVIDVKDDFGYVLWPSQVRLSQKVQRRFIRNPKQLVTELRQKGIYVIARIVCFKDSQLPMVRPDLAVRFLPSGRRLFRAGAGWLDAYAIEVQDYLIDLALEWESFGVDEIQFDYIRFPKGRAGKAGLWLHSRENPRDRDHLIASFLERADRALRVPLSVDVYGLTTLVDGDPRRLGQRIELMAPFVEVLSPMMYANGMASYFRKKTVTEHVYNIIQCGLWRARNKAPNVVLRPYLQAYPNNVSFYGPKFIVGQVRAAHRAGADGFLFWNSTMRNGVSYRALRSARRDLIAFNTPREGKSPGKWCVPSGKGNVFGRRRSANVAKR